MKRKTRRRTFIETKQIALVVDSVGESGSPCRICGDSRVVSPLLAAQILQTNTRAIYRLIEAERVHFVENAAKQLFVCLETLAAAIAEKTVSERAKASVYEKKN